MTGCVTEVFATSAFLDRYDELGAAARSQSLPVHVCDEDAIGTLAGSNAPQGVVAVCRFVDVPLQAALTARPLLVAVAAHVREPGNAGSLVRCADAAGAGIVVFAGSTVDPYNDKAVRASTGSLFHVPLVIAPSVLEVITVLQDNGYRVLAADGTASIGLDEQVATGALRGQVAWVFGNEAWGIPPEEQSAVDAAVAVPLYGRAESLNVATAAAVCLYATAWAQRSGGPGQS